MRRCVASPFVQRSSASTRSPSDGMRMLTNEGDPHEQVRRLEARIEELVEAIERCRKIALMSKVVIAFAVTLILATAIGAIRFDPMIVVGSIAATIGGTVLLGSNRSTSGEAAAALKTAESERATLIGELDLRVIDEPDRPLPPRAG
jgi:hypothetical protein